MIRCVAKKQVEMITLIAMIYQYDIHSRAFTTVDIMINYQWGLSNSIIIMNDVANPYFLDRTKLFFKLTNRTIQIFN